MIKKVAAAVAAVVVVVVVVVVVNILRCEKRIPIVFAPCIFDDGYKIRSHNTGGLVVSWVYKNKKKRKWRKKDATEKNKDVGEKNAEQSGKTT